MRELFSRYEQETPEDIRQSLGIKEEPNMSIGTPAEVNAPLPVSRAPAAAAPIINDPYMQDPQTAALGSQMSALGSQQASINELKNATLAGNEASRKALQSSMPTIDEMLLNKKNIVAQEKLAIEKQAEIEKVKIDVNSAIQEHKEATVDSGRLWRNMGTTNKILAGISIFLSGIASGGKGPNNAMTIIDSAIDRDIKEQEQNLAKKGTVISEKRGLLADLTSQFGNITSAKKAYQVIAAENVQNQLALIASKTNDAQVKANAQQMSATIELSKATLLKDVYATAQMKNVMLQTKSIKSQERDAAIEWLAMNKPEVAGKAVNFGDELGVYGIIQGSEGTVTKVKTALADASSAITMVKDLQAMGNVSGMKKLPLSEIKARAGQLKIMLQGSLKTSIVGEGAISEPEWKILDEVIANPTSYSTLNAQEKLDELQKRILLKTRNIAKTSNLTIDKEFGQKSSSRKEVEGTIGKGK